jgi:hypothetical protein
MDVNAIETIKKTIEALGEAFPKGWYYEYIVRESGTLESGLIWRHIGFKIDTSVEKTAFNDALNIYTSLRGRFDEILPGALYKGTFEESMAWSPPEFIISFIWIDEEFNQVGYDDDVRVTHRVGNA